jgi:L-malate glycosyltransferase
MKVIHLTAHLGGGVGRALCGLIANTHRSNEGVERLLVSLEAPENPYFYDLIKQHGCDIIVSPGPDQLHDLVETSDIVQLEWWNHPDTIKGLCGLDHAAMRLVVWCHISGLYNPIIPQALIKAASRFVLTSPCSLGAEEVKSLPPQHLQAVDIIHSCGGVEHLPLPNRTSLQPLCVGYFGSLNFAKLHPEYVDFLTGVKTFGFSVKMIGEAANKDILEKQCRKAGCAGILEFHGYDSAIAGALENINVLAYLLNPLHYGTTENALLEAMAMGIVPIVLNNPAERCIVEDRRNGLIVKSKEDFFHAINWLYQNPDKRVAMGRQAAESVRQKYSGSETAASFNAIYSEVISSEKKKIPFKKIFGNTPDDWFLSCQSPLTVFGEDPDLNRPVDPIALYGLTEQTKGTVFHFQKKFPHNAKLNLWAARLRSQIP